MTTYPTKTVTTAMTLALMAISMTPTIHGFVPPTGMTRVLEMESIKTLDYNRMFSERSMSSSDDVSDTDVLRFWIQ
jgi:hypothetical protein